MADKKGKGSATAKKANAKASKRWTIRLAISELSGTTWRPKKVSKGFLATDFAEELPDPDSFNFFVWGVGAAQSISCLGPDGLVDMDARTSFAYVPNRMTMGLLVDQRALALLHALWAGLAA